MRALSFFLVGGGSTKARNEEQEIGKKKWEIRNEEMEK